ncbi:pickpocket protein 28-like [Bradysia coprophila]|uniref:pickpocket protein 28-like n=1 Tax=Bradysia coprophila TaxID=38358 RepID=UPI00187DC5EC|nr:pickpocket protein 28-like [Bradysia coprophila]
MKHLFSVNFTVTQFTQLLSGFILIVHPPDEFPLFLRRSVITSIKAESFNNIRLTPHLVVSEGIEKYEPNVRQCYYGHERHLKYYKTYTQNHCESECLADYTLDQCGCVPYFMPRACFNDTKICRADSECDLNAVDKLFLPKFNDDGTHALIDDCNCLQTCTQLSYTVEVVELPEELAGYDGSALIIGNEHPFFTKNIRTELHSLSEFFSNCGGSLGLFLGVSILSIVELLYFCTARLYLHSKKRTTDSTE